MQNNIYLIRKKGESAETEFLSIENNRIGTYSKVIKNSDMFHGLYGDKPGSINHYIKHYEIDMEKHSIVEFDLICNGDVEPKSEIDIAFKSYCNTNRISPHSAKEKRIFEAGWKMSKET
jgi:hypothetical protein